MKKVFFLIIAGLIMTACDKEKDDINPNDKPGTETPEEPIVNEDEPVNIAINHTLPMLHTDGRWLVDESGEHVNLHGFWQTYSPWFNGDAWGKHSWGDYNVAECLRYNQNEIDRILESGWKMDFMRLHMDPYWSLSRSRPYPTSRQEYEDFNETLFKKYLDEVFVPMVEYCISKGLYVVLMPGYSAPECLAKDDQFHQVLTRLWTNISRHPKLCNNMDVMFELVNEPRQIKDANGVAGGNDDSHNKALTEYMQSLVDLIRKNAKNIIWVPGTGYQSQYAGYAKYKINDDNYGFAVHCYPGWYGSDAEKESAELGGAWGGGFESFKGGWDAQIAPAAKIAPIMVTEMDWAPEMYNKSWGKSVTGEAGGHGFGANFKWLVEETGNVSYILFTAPNDLADFGKYGKEGAIENYWNDQRGCPWQIFHWYEDYAAGRIQPESAQAIAIGGAVNGQLTLQKGGTKRIIANALNGTRIAPIMTGAEISIADKSIAKLDGEQIEAIKAGKTTMTVRALGVEKTIEIVVEEFNPFDFSKFNPSIWEEGTFDKETKTFVTGKYGFAGWQYSPGLNLKNFSKIVCRLGDGTDDSAGASLRIFDGGGYWGGAKEVNFKNREAVIELSENMTKSDGNKLDVTNITIIGIWTYGGKPVEIKEIFIE